MADHQEEVIQGAHSSPFSFRAIFTVLYHIFVACGYTVLPTVEDFCWDVVREHIREVMNIEDHMGFMYDTRELVLSSSNYAIAAQRLGRILDPEMKEYTARRGGSRFYLSFNKWIGDTPTLEQQIASDYIVFRDVIRTLDMLNRIQVIISGFADLIPV
jgi:hypothetical protein